ncbi:MAG: preprotein translocase subunit SecE [Buchnera aphidicola (Nurudea yanoniella)]
MIKKTKIYNKIKILNIIKWISIGILITLIFLNNYYDFNLSFTLHTIITIFLISSISVLMFSIKKWKKITLLIQETKKETKKITWPSFKETLHITIIVIIATFLISLILWGLDNFLIRLVSFLISLRI